MIKININNIKYNTKISAKNFSLSRSLSCGQAFRWNLIDNLENKEVWFGVAKDKGVFLRQEKDIIYLSCEDSQKQFWINYLALNIDYSKLESVLLANPKTAPSLEFSRGIRVFKQDGFETLISFIISANNNVKRISGIIENLSKKLGEKKELFGHGYFAFPSIDSLANADVELIKACGAGYRAQYIINSAKIIQENNNTNNNIFEEIKKLEFTQAKKELIKFSGVGPKVAACIMLFALDFDAAFPVDVWVKRIVGMLFEYGDDEAAALKVAQDFGNLAGAAQQYLFHYARQINLGK